MPEKSLPPEWIMTIWAIISTALAGVFGALLRQIANPRRNWIERITEWIVGGAMAVVASPVVAEIIHYMLLKSDMIPPNAGLSSENIMGLAGFLCGAFGVSAVELFIIWARKRFGIPPCPK